MSIRKSFNMIIKPLPDSIEKFIITKLNKKPPKSYAEITNDELNYVYNETIKKYPENKFEISKDLIKSIRSSYMKNYMIKKHKNLFYNSKKIYNDYENNMDILDLTKKYDVSPLNILREVFKKKYNKKLGKIIIKPNLLSTHDKSQMEKAIDHDTYALIDNSQIQKDSLDFEKKIQDILDNLGIKYKTQEELVKEQTLQYGKPINTPDFLIDVSNELVINDKKINWIDAKNFYGANIPFVVEKISDQTKKYIDTWGDGSIIYSLGFNEILNNSNNILNLDYSNIKLNN